MQVLVAGEPIEVPADTLVVGDVIELEAGETVPADCRLLEAAALEVDESALTGESLPVAKTVGADAGRGGGRAGLDALRGHGHRRRGRRPPSWSRSGRDTEAGRSAAAAADPPPSGVEQRLERLTRLTVPVTLGAGARSRPARLPVPAPGP